VGAPEFRLYGALLLAAKPLPSLGAVVGGRRSSKLGAEADDLPSFHGGSLQARLKRTLAYQVISGAAAHQGRRQRGMGKFGERKTGALRAVAGLNPITGRVRPPALPGGSSAPGESGTLVGARGRPPVVASGEMGLEIDVEFAPEPGDDVLLLSDSEILEDEPGPAAESPRGPTRPAPRLSQFVAAFSHPRPKGGVAVELKAALIGAKNWIVGAVAIVLLAGAWAAVQKRGPFRSMRPAETTTPNSAVTSPPSTGSERKAGVPRTEPGHEARAYQEASGAVMPAATASAYLSPTSMTPGEAVAKVAPGAPVSPQQTTEPSGNSVAARPVPGQAVRDPGRAANAPRARPAAEASLPGSPASLPKPPAAEERPVTPKDAPPESAPAPAFGDVDVAPPFDQAAAMQALRSAADAAKGCRAGDVPSGAVRVAVTFARGGRVAQANVEDSSLAATPVGACIAARFRAIEVPPFRGSTMTVRKTMTF
jgi:hypothetical protein